MDMASVRGACETLEGAFWNDEKEVVFSVNIFISSP